MSKTVAIFLVTAQLTAFISLAVRGLARHYPALMAYLAASMVRGVSLGWFDLRSKQYLDLWLWTLPLVIVLQICVGAECYRRSFSELPGIARVIHYPIWAICLLAALGLLLMEGDSFSHHVLVQVQRAVAAALLAACLGSSLMVSFLRPWRRRNIIRHERLLVAHFCAVTLVLLFPALSLLNGLVSIACCAGWAFLLRAEGEDGLAPHALPETATAGKELLRLREGIFGMFR